MITLKCDCGEKRDLHYGERWSCESCGRTWDTRQIPRAEYEAVRRVRTKFVAIPVAMLLGVIVAVALFIVYGRVFAIILLPLAMTLWSLYGRRIHRRRLR
ncbi:MAG: hypothetical protein ACRDL8_16930, partial [Solirubrobacteraceae bacterium]